MEDLGSVGVIAALILLIQTLVAAISVAKSRHYVAAYRWRKRMEPIHLDLLDWAYEVQKQAAQQGRRRDLPPLPESLQGGWIDDEELNAELLVLKRQVERRHDNPQQ